MKSAGMGKGFGPPAKAFHPSSLPGAIPGKYLRSGARVSRRRVDLLDGFDLRRRQTSLRVRTLALQRLGIEITTGRIFEDAIADAVPCVARRERRLIDQRELVVGNGARRVLERGMSDPQLAHEEVGQEVDRRDRHDPVVISGIALYFEEALPSTSRTSAEIRELWTVAVEGLNDRFRLHSHLVDRAVRVVCDQFRMTELPWPPAPSCPVSVDAVAYARLSAVTIAP